MIDPKILQAMVDAGCTAEELAAAYKGMYEAKQAQGAYSIRPALRAEVADKCDHRCFYCGDGDGPFHCDHLTPYSRGGQTALHNLVLACKSCNSRKRDKTLEEYRSWVGERNGTNKTSFFGEGN